MNAYADSFVPAASLFTPSAADPWGQAAMRLAEGSLVADLAARLEARVLVPPLPEARYQTVCLSETISEALRDAGAGCALVVPLGNAQVIHAASLLEASVLIVCGGLELQPEVTAEAERDRLALYVTALDAESCRQRLWGPTGLPALGGFAGQVSAPEQVPGTTTFPVLGGGYFMAGYASRQVRALLEAQGMDAELVRRVSIAVYEAEMNVVIYAPAGSISVAVTPEEVRIWVNDNGPGIVDVELAMKPGYSTAPPKARAMGFGAGMGLPNIAHCCDELSIERGPEVGGTRVFMRFRRGEPAQQRGEA